MREILLTQGRVAIVDDADFEGLTRFRWFFMKVGYAAGYPSGKPMQYMHRYIIGAGPGQEVDHINGNRLDNRRANLRLVLHIQNHRNRGKPGTRRFSSTYKGVSWRPDRNRWRAAIKVRGRQIHLGYFQDEVSAAHTYDAAAADIDPEHYLFNLRKEDAQ